MSYVKFPYQPVGEYAMMPFVWVRLKRNKVAIDLWALADTGSMRNVLPYSTGLRLGLEWNDFRAGPRLSGNAGGETRVVGLALSIGTYSNIQMSFCWSDNDNVRLILGHQDFFETFVAVFDTRNQEFSIQKHAEPS